MKVLFKNKTKYTKEMYKEFLEFHEEKYGTTYYLYTIIFILAFVFCIVMQLKYANYLLALITAITLIGFVFWRFYHPIKTVKKEIKSKKIEEEQEIIPYETITKDASQGATDTKNRVIQQGQDGLKEVTYKTKYQNDEQIEKIVLSEEIIKEPIDRIVQVQKNIVTTSRAGYERTQTTGNKVGETRIFKVTAYCSCAKCCGKTNGITASGTKATAGRTVATSSQFSFGTQLDIGGYTYTVEDRGGAIQGNRIDVYMNSHAEALAWGVRYLPVTVVE